MKKLSLLVALALLITVGGVYATWSYAGTNDIADQFAEMKVTIADTKLDGANGTYKIESNVVLIVDQNTDKHDAKLVIESNNDADPFLKVTFTPSTFAPDKIKSEAVPSELYWGTTVDMKYTMDAEGNYKADGTPKDIFTFSNTGDGVLNNIFTWNPETNGTFTYTLDKTALEAAIKLNDEDGTKPFILDIKAEHDEFRKALKGNIVARVTDGTVN